MDNKEIQTLNEKAYTQQEGKVIEDSTFEHLMALSLDPNNHHRGLIRCITKREGNVAFKGFVDKSQLYLVKSMGKDKSYEIAEPIRINNQDEIIQGLEADGTEFLGLEDPDIYFDNIKGRYHVYFTVPFIEVGKHRSHIHLGHAEGSDLDKLDMTVPVLSPSDLVPGGAKELSMAPTNKNGSRINLVESSEKLGGTNYSTVRAAVSEDYGPSWEFGNTLLHPRNDSYHWCAGHMSPGPLLPDSFIDLGKNKRVGILNGREANIKEGGKTKYGVFSAGLFVYDFEKGQIDWISESPLIIDSQAKTITFASEFIQTDSDKGLLYAHVDDSFVRAYTLYSEEIKKVIK